MQLLVDDPAPGPWNMAVDQVLLESAAQGSPTFRLYRWEQPTVSLGYFQPVAGRARHASSLACSLVRRCTGGGAIVHDIELTYSVTLPSGDRWSQDADQLYDRLHATLAAALAEQGLVAQRAGAPAEPTGDAELPRAADQPFLCFQRRAEPDLLVGSHKVVGSAQRRSRGALLQHGSILLGRSPFAPELPGLEQLSDEPFDAARFCQTWLDILADRLAVQWVRGALSDEQRRRVDQLIGEKYGSLRWTARR